MSEHELWNELGNLYFMSGAYEQAIHAYHRSIQMDSAYGRPYSNLALTYVHQGKYDEAVKLFRKSLDLLADNKEKAISWNRLGKVYRHLKDYQQAVVAFQYADELDPECKEDSEKPEQMLYASSDLSGIIQESDPLPDLEEVAASDIVQTPAVSTLEITTDASAFADLPQSDESMQVDSETLSLTDWSESDPNQTDIDWSPAMPDDAEIYLSSTDTENSGDEFAVSEEETIAEIHQFEMDESSDELFQSASIEPLNWPPAEKQSFSHSPINRVDFSEAEQQASESSHEVAVDVEELPVASFAPVEEYQVELVQTQTEPVRIESTDQTSVANSQETTDLEKEIAKYKRVVQINERNASAWDALGTLYKSAGLYKESILAHQQAISIESTRASYHHHLGLAFAGAGRDEDAISAFQKVIELDPNHYLAHASLGGYYRKLGLEELSQKHIGKAMRNIYDSESEYNRACLDAICGNVDQAIDLLRIALEKKQTYVEWIIHDPDLDFIREDARFKQLISNYAG